eukprot:425295_1
MSNTQPIDYLLITQEIEEEKENEYKFNATPHENIISWKPGIHFTQPQESDYVECQRHDHQIQNCNVIKRIIYLLTYYQQYPSKYQHPQLYEYFTSLQKYDVPTFLEDCHQAKNNHLTEQNDVAWMIKSMGINCNAILGCEFVRRYKRDRDKYEFDSSQVQIDYKNIILMDELDSIHTIIFHSTQQSTKKALTNIQCKDDEAKDEEPFLKPQIWNKQPKSILECNTEQIVWIIKNDLFDKLKPKIKDNLIHYKAMIIRYLEEQKFDGNKLKQFPRKAFAAEIIQYLKQDDTKLNGSLVSLYTAITKYDISNLFKLNEEKEKENDDDLFKLNEEHVWSNKPRSIENCNVAQIISMLDYFLVDKENKLMKYKQEIIKYITQEQFNGYKLNKLSRKDFINQLADHLNDRKTKPLLGKLRKNVLECNLSRFTGFQRNETIQEFTQSHNKFNTTIMTVENETDAYYSFGKQYRYTKNLREHPFYVKPKFSSLKTELHEYFIQNEKQVLLERQIKTIKSFPTNLQAILTSLVKGSIFPEMKTEIEFDRESCMEIFWMDKLKNKYDLMQSLLSIEENSFQQLNSIITQLCCDLHEEAVIINFSTILFITLLRIKKRAHEELIVACTRNYINKIVADCDWDITDCDEHKSYNNECNKCSKTNVGARSIFANVNSYVDNSSKKSNQKNKSKDNDKDDNNFEHSKSAESKLNDVVNDALSICAFALDAN